MMNKRSRLCLALVFLSLLPLSMLAQAGGQATDDSPRLAAAGQQAMAAGQFEEARSDFEQLAKLNPGIAEAHATLAVIYFKLRDYEGAVREIRTAQKLKPSLPKLDGLLGLSLAELGRFTEATPRLEKEFKLTTDPEIKRMCGLQLLRGYTRLGHDEEAVQTSIEMNKLYPDDPEVLYNTGRIYGNFAYLVMEKLHDKAPGSIWMLQAQGEANEAGKSYDAAIVAFNHVLDLDPQRPGIHYRLGRIHLERFKEQQKQEEKDSAQKEFTAELAVDPTNGNAAYELANMEAENGKLDEARNGYEQVLKLYPDFEEALVGLGGVLIGSHKAELAVAPLEHATQINPDDEVVWYRLSLAERAAGNREAQQKALAAFQKLHDANAPQRRPNSGDEVTPQKIGADANP
jgi:tetratricopeptide (TPR) repeat protein